MPRPNPIEYAERLYAAIRAANFSPISFLAFGGIEDPPISNVGAYVRDRTEQTTTLVSRADGLGGAAADADVDAASISGSGDCVAFSGRFANLGDGFGSPDFRSVHLRTLSGECPGADAVPPGSDGDGTGEPGASGRPNV